MTRSLGLRSVPSWMIACLVVAAGLRLFRLGHQSLWIDELISLQLATYAQGAEFWRGLLIDIHGPFLSAVLHGWVRLGESETWLRLLFVLPALATIPVVYVLARDLFDERTGRVAAWILALSPFHVWYSQEVRSYAWAILWAAIALVLFLRAWDGRGARGTWIALAAVLALGVLTNFSLVFLPAALSLLSILRRPFSRRFVLAWCGVLAAVGLVFLPWFLDWYGRIGGERIFVDAPSPLGVPLREDSGFAFAEVPYAAWAFVYGYSLGPSLTQLHLDRSLPALGRHAPVLLVGAAAAAGVFLAGLTAVRERGRAVLLGVLIGVPLLLCVYLAARGVKTFHPRYLVTVFPLVPALLAAGWIRGTRATRAAGGVVLLLVAVSLGQHYFDPTYAKEDSRSAARLIVAREEPGDSVVVIYSFRPFRHYFSDRGTGHARLHHVHKRFLRTDEDMRAHVAEASDGSGRVWLVLSRWWDVAPEAQIRSAFEATLTEEQRWSFPGVKVTLYDRRAA